MLGHHPQVEILGEFEEAVELLGEFGWTDLERFHQHIRASRRISGTGITIDESLDYPSLVRDLWAQACTRTSKPNVGASIHSRFDRCPDIWPDARYIHVLRDPRDVARSCIGMGWVGNVFHGARIWIEAEEHFKRLKAQISSDHYFELRYEELVRDPQSVLRGVCEFLNLEYDAQMLSYSEHSSYSKPNPKLIEQWRHKLSPREVQRVEWRCGSLLGECGYQASEYGLHEVGAAERVYLGVDNSIKRTKAAIERYGLPLWLADRTSRVMPSALRERIVLSKNAVDAARLE